MSNEDDIFDLNTEKGLDLAKESMIMFLKKSLTIETSTVVRLKTKYGDLVVSDDLYPYLSEALLHIVRSLSDLQTLGAQRSIRALIEENLGMYDKEMTERLENEINDIRKNLVASIDAMNLDSNMEAAFYGISSTDPALKSITDRMEPQEHPPFMAGHDLSVDREGDSIKIPSKEDIKFLNLEDKELYPKALKPKKITTKNLIIKRH